MGLSITEIATLVTKGYKVSEISEVNDIVSKNPDEGKNIVEIAKKLGYSDFKTAMQLFDKAGVKEPEKEPNLNETDHNDESSPEEPTDDNPDQGKEDDVDYKKLYEDEKKLREKLQQNNQNKDASGNDTDKRTDEEIALQFCADVLN